jgi:large subunit ribosomal protein L21
MANFAVIATGGKQYVVEPGMKLKLEKLAGDAGDVIAFENVLLKVDGDSVKVGAPNVDGGKVEAKVLRQMRDRKKIVFKYHSKTRYRKHKGHRQHLTEVEITKI